MQFASWSFEPHGGLRRTRRLRGLTKREVLEVQEVAFEGQTNITLVYDAWSRRTQSPFGFL